MKFGHTLLLLTALSGVASAATIVQSQNYSFIPIGSAPLTFNQFDSLLGTLTGITITTNLTKSGGSLAVDNESAEPASGNISQSVTISLTSSVTIPSGSSITVTTSNLVSVAADDGDVSTPGGGVQTTGPDYVSVAFGSISNTGTTNVIASNFAAYQGLGSYIINADGIQFNNTSAFGGASGAFTPATATGDVTVTYIYEAIPEPTSAVIGGLGLLTLLRRRRR